MSETPACKELRQMRAILGKILKHLNSNPRSHGPRHRSSATAKNVTRLTTAAIEHLDHGHTDIAKQLIILLDQEEGTRVR